MKKVSRREFARGVAIAPIALAAGSSVFAHAASTPPSQAAPAPAQHAPNPEAAANRVFSVAESEPFASPLQFVRNEASPKLEAFSLGDVTLDAGPLQQARDWNRGYMMRLPNDRLLHNFRFNAGLPSNATPLGGWEAPTCEVRGHFVGHYLSACSMLYAATGDKAVKSKADQLVAGLAACQTALNQNGYLSAFPVEFFDRLDRRENVWAPFYTMHKIMAGLLDMKTQAANDQALRVVVKMAGWVDAWTAAKTEDHMQDILNTEYGGMNDVLYNLAAVTGDDRWAHAGDRFTKKIFFTPLALRRDALKGQHMNTHVPQVIGAARRYEISSDFRFADVSRFFFETVSQARTYATGGSSNNEHWLTDPDHLALEMRVSSHHQECCCSYNMMKLARHLYKWSGESRFIDYYERNLLNHRLGAIEPVTGHTTYFLSLAPGAWKTTCTEDASFWCCTGTALEEFSKLNDTVYFHDEASLFVNLFFASSVNWKERGVRLRQSTNFPESNSTEFTIEKTPDTQWSLRLRIPSWTTPENSVALNGRRLEVSGTPGSYLAISRIWKAGDRVQLTLPMRLTAEPLADDRSQQALLYGPLVLAGQFPKTGLEDDLEHNQGPELGDAPPLEVPALKASGADPSSWVRPVPGEALAFRTIGQEREIDLKPLNQSWQRFAVYWTVS
ncbi:MAG: glycoside hydrolase family 127 protein [Terracidiphilus sp.]